MNYKLMENYIIVDGLNILDIFNEILLETNQLVSTRICSLREAIN
jgi:hypothetical protein|tara:strand:+ start:1797 stop:1931 length:135 start_codon:yes stop_codon:yes gene_type:complete